MTVCTSLVKWKNFISTPCLNFYKKSTEQILVDEIVNTDCDNTNISDEINIFQ